MSFGSQSWNSVLGRLGIHITGSDDIWAQRRTPGQQMKPTQTLSGRSPGPHSSSQHCLWRRRGALKAFHGGAVTAASTEPAKGTILNCAHWQTSQPSQVRPGNGVRCRGLRAVADTESVLKEFNRRKSRCYKSTMKYCRCYSRNTGSPGVSGPDTPPSWRNRPEDQRPGASQNTAPSQHSLLCLVTPYSPPPWGRTSCPALEISDRWLNIPLLGGPSAGPASRARKSKSQGRWGRGDLLYSWDKAFRLKLDLSAFFFSLLVSSNLWEAALILNERFI